eukprot:3775632-Rhodomonas_salina.1
MLAEYTQQVLWSEVASFQLPQLWRIILHCTTYAAVASASIWSAPLQKTKSEDHSPLSHDWHDVIEPAW